MILLPWVSVEQGLRLTDCTHFLPCGQASWRRALINTRLTHSSHHCVQSFQAYSCNTFSFSPITLVALTESAVVRPPRLVFKARTAPTHLTWSQHVQCNRSSRFAYFWVAACVCWQVTGIKWEITSSSSWSVLFSMTSDTCVWKCVCTTSLLLQHQICWIFFWSIHETFHTTLHWFPT